ncbi:hypothetical protein V866_005359 [Kwoniella sp. B9012]
MSFVPPPTTPLTYGFTDHIVHSINKVDIALRVFPARDDGTKRPWLIWVHGGAYIAGKHSTLPPSSSQHSTIKQTTTSSHSPTDYYLKSPSKTCGTTSPSNSTGGDSSGGHFATLAGFRLSHTSPPKVIISLYGIVNPLDPYFEQESEHEITPDYGTPPNVLMRMLEDREKSRARIFAPWNWEMPPALTPEQLEADWGYKYEITDEDKRTMDLNNHIHKKGIRMNLLFREETFIWKERYVEKVKKWSPIHLTDTLPNPYQTIDDRQERKVYPPLCVLHGDEDRTVPFEQSKRFAEGLKKKGVAVKEIYPEGKGHTFDYVITGPNDEGWKDYIQPLISLVKIHLEE